VTKVITMDEKREEGLIKVFYEWAVAPVSGAFVTRVTLSEFFLFALTER